MCTLTPGNKAIGWIIDNVLYTLPRLHSGVLTGYSSKANNLITDNVMMNDDRNGTKYSCGTLPSTVSNPVVTEIEAESAIAILYVAGKYTECYVFNSMLCIAYMC